MDETKGAKGSHNDLLRTLKITENFKKKLSEYQKEENEKELKKLEKKVKQQQLITFFKILPIVVIGNLYQTITSKTKEEIEIENLKDIKETIETEELYDEKITKQITKKIDTKIEIIELRKKNNIQEEQNDIITLQISPEEVIIIDPLHSNEIETVKAKDFIDENKKEIIEKEQLLTKLKTKKIVEEYENNLKETRKNLRELSFEYNVLQKETDKVETDKEADEVLDKLSTLITKVEELKKKIELDNYSDYDSNYLHVLVSDYLKDFEQENIREDLKDSALYIELSNKLKELDNKQTNIKEKIQAKKEIFEIDEAKLDIMKNKYYDFERFNNDLIKFQYEQDAIMKDIQTKIKNAETVEEQVEIKVQGIRRQNKRLRNLLALQLMLPGARTAKSLATAAVTSLYFTKNVLFPKQVKRRYKVVKVSDYSKEIESSINSISDIENLLKKTSSQIDKIIKDINREYSDYFDICPDCKKLIDDLEKVKQEITEKEYEIKKVKEQQEKHLEKNNAKVKVYS